MVDKFVVKKDTSSYGHVDHTELIITIKPTWWLGNRSENTPQKREDLEIIKIALETKRKYLHSKPLSYTNLSEKLNH